MIPSAGVIKKTAKDILAKNHFLGIVACLPIVFLIAIIMVISSVLSEVTDDMISIITSAVLSVFLVLPLFLGTVRFFSRCTDNVCDYPSTVFYYFSSILLYKKSITFILFLFVRLVISAFLLSLPAIIVGVFSISGVYELIGIPIPLWSPILSTVSMLLFILAGFVFLLVNLKYYLYVYLLVIDENITPGKALKQSMIISRRTQIDFVYLFISMFIYIILSVFFLPLLFTLPIMITVYIIHSKCAVLQYNTTIDALKNNHSPCD